MSKSIDWGASRMNRLAKLEELDLSDNALTVLPPDIEELIRRRIVRLTGNPLSEGL